MKKVSSSRLTGRSQVRRVVEPLGRSIEPVAGRSKFEVARVRREVGPALQGLVFSDVVVSKSVSSPDVPFSRRVVSQPQSLPLDRQDVAVDRPLLCKKRPPSNRGSGGSRRFVPWCGK